MVAEELPVAKPVEEKGHGLRILQCLLWSGDAAPDDVGFPIGFEGNCAALEVLDFEAHLALHGLRAIRRAGTRAGLSGCTSRAVPRRSNVFTRIFTGGGFWRVVGGRIRES